MYEPEHLKRWSIETFDPSGLDGPDNYAGERPEGYYCGPARTRDSDDLSNSNFECVLRDLGGESETVKVLSFGHWACGWIEIIGIHESDEARLRQADEIAEALEDYPIWDEDDYSERVDEAALQVWGWLDLRERVELVKDRAYPAATLAMIVACRKDTPPQDDGGEVWGQLRDWAVS